MPRPPANPASNPSPICRAARMSWVARLSQPARRPWPTAAILSTLLLASALAQNTPLPAPAPPPPAPAAPAPATKPADEPETREHELTLRDGRTITGKLISKTDENIVFTVGGVATTFPITAVSGIKVMPTVEERYKELKAAIDENDAPGLMRLAEWLRSHNRCDLALFEVDAALKADPGNPDGRQLKLLIVEQQKLLDAAARFKAKAKAKPDPASESTPEPTTGKPVPPPAFPLLNEAQINTIRAYEVDLNNPPKMTISREVIDKFLAKYAGQRVEGRDTIPSNEAGRAIYARKKPAEILADMFSLRARDFYAQVKVLENPRALQLFRDNVNRNWLTNSCATTRCHGGEDAGRLYLYDKKTASDAAAYTNFLIIDRFKINTGDKSPPIPLIDYNEPANSPLLQMALPRAEAKFKHPDVNLPGQRWKPVFRSTDDERFVQAVEWIKAMYPKRVEYPIDFTAPAPRADAKANEDRQMDKPAQPR